MILRNPRESLFDEPAENGFEAIDEKSGERLGCCVVHPEPNPALFPARPNNYRLEFAGEFSAFGRTVGAAMALARVDGGAGKGAFRASTPPVRRRTNGCWRRWSSTAFRTTTAWCAWSWTSIACRKRTCPPAACWWRTS